MSAVYDRKEVINRAGSIQESKRPTQSVFPFSTSHVNHLIQLYTPNQSYLYGRNYCWLLIVQMLNIVTSVQRDQKYTRFNEDFKSVSMRDLRSPFYLNMLKLTLK